MPETTGRRSAIAHALKQARKAAGLTQDEAAEKAPYSQSSIGRIERGQKTVSEKEIVTLLDCYDAPPEVREELAALCMLAEQTIPIGMEPSPRLVELARVTTAAVAVYTFHSDRLPRQLQSDHYATLQNELSEKRYSPRDVVYRLKERRDAFLVDGRPYHALMTESSVMQVPGAQLTVRQDQAQHLITLMNEHPNFQLQILPMPANLSHIETDFTLLEMAHKRENTLCMAAGETCSLTKDRSQFGRIMRYWRRAQEEALSVEETAKYLNDLA